MLRLLFSLDGRIGPLTYLAIGLATRAAWLGMLAVLHHNVIGAGLAYRFGALQPLAGLTMLVCLWINFAAAVKRLHDQGRRGYWLVLEAPAAWVLYGILTLLFYGVDRTGYLALAVSSFIFAIQPGTPGPNRFGPRPAALTDRIHGRTSRPLWTRGTPDRSTLPAAVQGPVRTRPRNSIGGAALSLLMLIGLVAGCYAMR